MPGPADDIFPAYYPDHFGYWPSELTRMPFSLNIPNASARRSKKFILAALLSNDAEISIVFPHCRPFIRGHLTNRLIAGSRRNAVVFCA